MDVRIEAIDRDGKRLWQVRLGRRVVTFEHEQAARALAAQLHMRAHWLRQEAETPRSDSQPTQ